MSTRGTHPLVAPLPPTAVPLAALAALYARADRWAEVPAAVDRALAADAPLAAAARRARRALVHEVARRLGPLTPLAVVDRWAGALVAVPRERFVLPEDIALSAEDLPLALDPDGLATVSAPHAYVLTYGLLDLGPGDHLVELGTGTGYGAALASPILGPAGRITSIEIDPRLAARAARVLALLEGQPSPRLRLLCGDGIALGEEVLAALGPDAPGVKVATTFALATAPEALIALLPEGSTLVAPIGPPDGAQELERWERHDGAVRHTRHGPVRYVTDRRGESF